MHPGRGQHRLTPCFPSLFHARSPSRAFPPPPLLPCPPPLPPAQPARQRNGHHAAGAPPSQPSQRDQPRQAAQGERGGGASGCGHESRLGEEPGLWGCGAVGPWGCVAVGVELRGRGGRAWEAAGSAGWRVHGGRLSLTTTSRSAAHLLLPSFAA